MPNKKIRIAIIVAASLSLIFAIIALVQFRKASGDERLTVEMRSHIHMIEARLEASKDQSLVKEATAEATRNEEATFIAFLKATAKDTNVTLVKWSLAAAMPNTNNPDDPSKDSKAKAKEAELLKGVTPLVGNLDIQGDFRSILLFTNRLLTAPRLYNIGLVTMSRQEDRKTMKSSTRMGMQLTRFVELPSAPIQEGQKI